MDSKRRKRSSLKSTRQINRALFQLFSRATNTEIRRALFFPAGTYIVTDVLKIPTFAKLVGDGHNSSIIKGTASGADCVAMTSDAVQQIDGRSGPPQPGRHAGCVRR